MANKPNNTAIVLAKASPTVLKVFQAYLSETFAIQDMHALKLPPTLLTSTLAKYISSIHTVLSRTTSERQLPLDIKAILGMLRLSVSFSAPIAPSLKMLDVEVPSESVLVAFRNLEAEQDSQDSGRQTQVRVAGDTTTQGILEVLSKWIHERTGLKLPLAQNEKSNPTATEPTNNTNPETTTSATQPPLEPPMRISRILCAAYAISSEGRLKFSLKAAQTCDNDPSRGDSENTAPDGSSNVVRKANEALLAAALCEANRQLMEDS